jgi:hypothetical protein
MSNARRIVVMGSLAGAAVLGLAGCCNCKAPASGEAAAGMAPKKADHPKGEHPKGEHPKGEHPK